MISLQLMMLINFRILITICLISKNLELKIEHQGTHPTFHDLDIPIEEGIFIYRFYERREVSFIHI